MCGKLRSGLQLIFQPVGNVGHDLLPVELHQQLVARAGVELLLDVLYPGSFQAVNGALDESRGTYIYGTETAYSDRTITVTMPEGTTNKQWAAYPLVDYYTKGEQLSSLPSQSGSFTDRTISFKMGDHEKLALELVDLDDNTDTKLDFAADLFTVTVDGKSLSEEFTAGTPHKISVNFNDATANVHITQFSYYTYNESAGAYENCKAVDIYDKSTWPTAAGKYKIAIAANDNSGKYN